MRLLILLLLPSQWDPTFLLSRVTVADLTAEHEGGVAVRGDPGIVLPCGHGALQLQPVAQHGDEVEAHVAHHRHVGLGQRGQAAGLRVQLQATQQTPRLQSALQPRGTERLQNRSHVIMTSNYHQKKISNHLAFDSSMPSWVKLFTNFSS